MATRSSKCKTCDARTTASAGYCQSCKSKRHRGYKRLKEENLLLDEAGGAWWIWNSRGDVVVAGKPTKDAAIIALAFDEDDVENDACAACASGDHHAKKKSPAQLDREIATVLARPSAKKRTRGAYGAHGDPLATAAGIVTARVRSSEAYRLGREEVVRSVVETLGPSPTVDRLKNLGGLTAVVRSQIKHASSPGLDDNLGSPMFPLTPRSLLNREADTLRSRVQQIVSKQA